MKDLSHRYQHQPPLVRAYRWILCIPRMPLVLPFAVWGWMIQQWPSLPLRDFVIIYWDWATERLDHWYTMDEI